MEDSRRQRQIITTSTPQYLIAVNTNNTCMGTASDVLLRILSCRCVLTLVSCYTHPLALWWLQPSYNLQ